ncbi:high affinity cAMP-specific and IBMX-insensitive 3',5'-cyclic phosphodiesterase 8-like isoform X2 [Rhodnius prolixus]|uniref:high affinity cAMP-specific and IBMX-insensitive 3',5'-cyclic phosphodiesterase 8-like isoform X2 n=1 Tax=Rhodnius prolixus TaxID=13249 RepID=UPI003D18B517
MGCLHSRLSSLPQGSQRNESGNGTSPFQNDKSTCPDLESLKKDTCSHKRFKVLFVAEETDTYWVNLRKCFDGKHNAKLARNAHQAILHYTEFLPDCVLIDLRTSCTDKLLRILRSIKVDHQVLFVAVIKSNDSENGSVNCPLEWGFDRIVKEGEGNSSVIDLVEQSYRCLPKEKGLRRQAALSECIYTALDKCRDLVIITDHPHLVQYVNSPCMQVLGFSKDELIGKQIGILHEATEVASVYRQLERGLEWVGRLKWRTKSADMLPLQTHALPFTPHPSLAVHYLYLSDNPLQTHISPRGSLPSIRKASYDLKSIISEGSARRQSLAKLYNLPLEAPITKVLSLLCAAQENASAGVVQMLEQVMDILRTTELYTSHLKAENLRAEDPLTTNLIAALVAQGPPSAVMPRRSSGDSVVSKKKAPSKRGNQVTMSMSKELKEVMDKISSWDFDVIQVEKLSGAKPLVYVGMKIFTLMGVPKTLGIDERTVYSWLALMERHYKPANTYHNSTHAADVLQATALFLLRLRVKKLLEPLDEACCLVAAAAHDLGHPGKSSAFLTNSGHYLAVLYNDISVLEQHHAALTFKLTLRDERVNIFKGLDRKMYTSARACIIDTILATDMFRHYEHYTKFVTVFNKSPDDTQDPKADGKTGDTESNVNPEDLMLVKRMLIKCADVSNPTRPLPLCKQWAKRIAEEYFSQTDEEKARNLPVVMPLFDRQTCSIPVSQMGFMDYIVNNMFEEWDSFIEMPEMLYHLRKNYDYWKELHDKGITGTGDANEHVELT